MFGCDGKNTGLKRRTVVVAMLASVALVGCGGGGEATSEAVAATSVDGQPEKPNLTGQDFESSRKIENPMFDSLLGLST